MCACSRIEWNESKKYFVCACCGCQIPNNLIERLYSIGYQSEQQRIAEQDRIFDALAKAGPFSPIDITVFVDEENLD